MAIAITKTLQSVEYDLYITTNVISLFGGSVVVEMKVYQSEGHYNDDFLPIIVKKVSITDGTTLTTFQANFFTTNRAAAIAAIEDYLVSVAGFYQGGTVV